MMAMDLDQLDRQRERWRRARAAMNLVDPRDPDFATAGLAATMAGVTFRVLVLPADPEAHVFDFDAEFWKWSETLRETHQRERLSLGLNLRPFSGAAVRFDDDGKGQWRRYLAIHHSGAVEIGCGADTGWKVDAAENQSGRSGFQLMPMYQRIGAALDIFSAFSLVRGCSAPAEVSVGLRGVAGAELSRFAPGWPEAGWVEHSIGREANVLLRREFSKVDEATFCVALDSLGVQIENSFGSQSERFRPANP